MRRFPALLAALACVASSALASGPVIEPPAIVPLQIVSDDWTGPYVGLFWASASGDMTDIEGTFPLASNSRFHGG